MPGRKKKQQNEKESLTSLMLAKGSSRTTEHAAPKEWVAAQAYIALGLSCLREMSNAKEGWMGVTVNQPAEEENQCPAGSAC